jgi:hypothetical protein
MVVVMMIPAAAVVVMMADAEMHERQGAGRADEHHREGESPDQNAFHVRFLILGTT